MAEKMEKKYVLTNRRSGKVLTAVGTKAVQLEANDSDAQIWRAIPTKGTAFHLVNKETGLVCSVCGKAENGALLTLDANAVQDWKLTTTTKGYRKLVHVDSGLVVDIKDISDSDYAPAQLWEYVKGENQDWIAKEVEKAKKAPAKRTAKKAE